MRSDLVTTATAIALIALAGTAVAGTIKVPKDQPTVQDGVNAATMGDKVTLAKGVYFENVVVMTAGIEIEGQEAILDGNILGVDGDCLTILAANVSVTGLTFRHGTNQIVLGAGSDGADIAKCTFEHSGGDGITGAASGVTLTSLKIRYTASEGVDLTGSDIEVSKCTVTRAGSHGVRLVGDGNEVVSCTLSWIADANGVLVTGNDAVVSKNKSSDGGGDCFVVEGDGADVEGNKVDRNDGLLVRVTGNDAVVGKNAGKYCRGGVRVVGDGADILSNNLTNTFDDAAVSVSGDDFTVKSNMVKGTTGDAGGITASSATPAGTGSIEKNQVTDAGGWGYFLGTVHSVTVQKNKATRCGSDGAGGYHVAGDNNTVAGNDSTESAGSGFSVEGNGNTVTDCTVKKSATDGFRMGIGTGNTFDDCTATNCGGEGFDNRGVDTELTDSSFSKNRIDVANDFANLATFLGGLGSVKFDTGGETTLPEVD